MGKTQRIVGVALIVLALVLGGYAWVLSQRMTASQHEAQPQMQPVVVAVNRIPAGTAILPEMLRVDMFPARPIGAYADIKAVAGKASASDILAGEPLLQERLEGGPRPLLQYLEPGQRAVAVRVDDVVAVGNRLNPGDRVDVFVTLRRNNEEIPDSQSRLLLERLQVLAFGSREVAGAKAGGDGARNNGEIPKTAVLAVRLEDVDKLALAAESGRLLLALRPPEQAAEATAVPVAAKALPAAITLGDLIDSPNKGERARRAGIPARGGGAGQAPAGKTVTVMHGLKEKTIYVGMKKNEARP